jgi:hypothetical protein
MIFSKFLDSLDFCFFVPVLNSFQYQDKEGRKKSKVFEKNTFKDSVHEISNIYSGGRLPVVLRVIAIDSGNPLTG